MSFKSITQKIANWRRYRTAVRELSFTVQPGEVVGLVGPNGAGKTTTLRLLATVMKPTEGTAVLDGHEKPAAPGGDPREPPAPA